MSDAKKPEILVVDDEAEQCELMSLLLRRSYVVRTAQSSSAAAEIVARTKLDVALVDFRLPDASGVDILANLKASQPDCVRFLVTAYSAPEIYQEAINRAAVYRFVAKPVEMEALRVDIQRALEHREAQGRLERAERLALVGQLAGSVVHDLRNCLQVIGFLPELLVAARSPDDVRDSAQRLREVDRRMRDLVTELLALAKGNPPTYERRPASLAEVVRETLKAEAAHPSVAQVKIAEEVEEGLPELPLARERCVRLVSNLVINAAQAAGPGGNVVVALRRSAGALDLEVRDDGPGVPAADVGRLFEPLYTTKGAAGVGLGLAICRAVMEGHGGSLTYVASSSRGATFRARFPLEGT